jgi:hypothetical protein
MNKKEDQPKHELSEKISGYAVVLIGSYKDDSRIVDHVINLNPEMGYTFTTDGHVIDSPQENALKVRLYEINAGKYELGIEIASDGSSVTFFFDNPPGSQTMNEHSSDDDRSYVRNFAKNQKFYAIIWGETIKEVEQKQSDISPYYSE